LESCKERIAKFRIVIILLFILLIFRTTYITAIWGQKLSVLTDNQYRTVENLGDINYSLQDYKGRELLEYTPKYYFVVEPDNFLRNNRDAELSAMKTVIYTLRNYNRDFDLSAINLRDVNRRLYYIVDESTYQKLKDITGVKGVYTFIKNEVNRAHYWKYENLISSPRTIDHKVKDETSIESFLHSKTRDNPFAKIAIDKDVHGNFTTENYIVPEAAVNVRLTTDKEIQDTIKEILQQEKYEGYGQIGVALMEAHSGKIRAMVQRDDWKPNILLASATENGYEPGSIYKTIVSAVALEEYGFTVNTEIRCEETNKNHGHVNMGEAFTVSCNTYFEKLAESMDFEKILHYSKAQGLFDKVLNFYGNGEVKGDYVVPDIYNGAIKNIAKGQSIRITPLQALSIVNTVINDGKYVKPYIIDSLVDINDNIIEEFTEEEHRVYKNNTARALKNMMLRVVRNANGTGTQAFVSGVEVGGKTGTNERLVRTTVTVEDGKKRTVTQKQSDGWFIGFYKVRDTYYSMVVFVNDINTESDSAGNTAAPIFREIVEAVNKFQ
jgi:cell division protein FtsI/penicillin-binding protein 2